MVEALDARDPAGRRAWLSRWLASPEREPMAHPAYAALFARDADRCVCLTAGDTSAGVLYPLILRPIAVEPWAAPGDDRWDATTPYGYGGPHAWGTPPPSADDFWDAAARWLADARVVTTFARLSLFPADSLPFRGEVVDLMPNVVRSLTLPPDDLWRDYAPKVRKNVNTARHAGLEFTLDIKGDHLAEFLAIYDSTMDRRDADEGFFFPASFFETLRAEMPDSVLFAHVVDRGRIVSSELVLRSRRRLYSFLGGTFAEAFASRPNDLLKHELIAWASAQGFESYVLGGGYGGPDGIFLYKRSFAPAGEVPFRVGRAVHARTDCDDLVARRVAFESARQGSAWEPRRAFFPAYRG